MKHDLAMMHRAFKARVRRLEPNEPGYDEAQRIVETSRIVRKSFEDNTIDYVFLEKFARMERSWLKLYSYSAESIVEKYQIAAASGDWCNTRSHIKNNHINFDPPTGAVYLLVSNFLHADAVKIGATTMKRRARENKFRSKYNCWDAQIVHWLEIAHPAEIEREVQRKLYKWRSAGNAVGDSIEWYGITIKHAKQTLTAVVKQFIKN